MHARLPLLSLSQWYDHLPQLLLTVGILLFIVVAFADPIFIIVEMFAKSRSKPERNTYVCDPDSEDVVPEVDKVEATRTPAETATRESESQYNWFVENSRGHLLHYSAITRLCGDVTLANNRRRAVRVRRNPTQP